MLIFFELFNIPGSYYSSAEVFSKTFAHETVDDGIQGTENEDF